MGAGPCFVMIGHFVFTWMGVVAKSSIIGWITIEHKSQLGLKIQRPKCRLIHFDEGGYS